MKKLLSLLLMITLAFGLIGMVPSGEAYAAGLTKAQLQAKFPAGKYWNHVGGSNNPDGVTSSPCPSHSNCSYTGSCSCNSFSNAIQCMGFAYKLGYDAFGSSPRSWSKVYNLNSLKPGDVIRYTTTSGSGHSVFVTAVTSTKIYFADCNYGNSCRIRWDASESVSYLSSHLSYVQVAPSTLQGGSSSGTPDTGGNTGNDSGNSGNTGNSNTAADPAINPVGEVDYLTAGENTIRYGGWAYDGSNSSQAIYILITVGGDLYTSSAERHYFLTNTTRSDVNSAYGISGTHGYEGTFYTKLTGNQHVYVYAINIKGGADVILWDEVLNIQDNPANHLALQFDDLTPTDWYYNAVSYVYNKGIMTGMSSTFYGATGKLKRAQFTSILYRIAGSPSYTNAANFLDCQKADWYTDSLNWAYENGVINGYSNGKFGPDDTITREQMAVILYNYAKLKGLNTGYSDSVLANYPDGIKVSAFAEEAMKWAISHGIISGRTQNEGLYLVPQGTTSRAEAATMIMNYCNQYGL